MSEAQAGAGAPQLTADQAKKALERLRKDQNLVGGLGAGVVAALIGAVVWAVVTDATGYQIGWMAIGVGFIVGYAVKFVGKGIDKSFGYLGAALALFGCVLGNALAVLGIVADAQHVTYGELWASITPSMLLNLMTVTFSPMDLLFYGIALYEGYKLSFRQLTADEVHAAAV
jgi:hypothetical protein